MTPGTHWERTTGAARRTGKVSLGWARTPRDTCTRPIHRMLRGRRRACVGVPRRLDRFCRAQVAVENRGGGGAPCTQRERKIGRHRGIWSRCAALTSEVGCGCGVRLRVHPANDRPIGELEPRLFACCSRPMSHRLVEQLLVPPLFAVALASSVIEADLALEWSEIKTLISRSRHRRTWKMLAQRRCSPRASGSR
jgi:hypothetical protein